jgi:RNA polymerase sigma factor (sigma-70 family)
MAKENNLWEAFKNGEKTAMKKLYEDNVDMLYSYGKRLVHDDELIYDAIHDIFVKLWDQRSKLNEPTSMKGYLVTVLRNHIIDGIRKNKTTYLDDSSKVFESDEESIEFLMINKQEEDDKASQLANSIDSLTANQKEIIYLKYQKEMSYEEIAQVMNINYQSVRNLAHRAITELRKKMTSWVLIILCIEYIIQAVSSHIKLIP